MAHITTEIVDITPAMARAWLAEGGHNRHLREQVWRRYMRDMAAGLWVLNGESIKRGVNGAGVLDGQHRLKAIAEGNVTVRSVVVTGLPTQAQETVDRGLARNVADALRLRGEINVNVLAGAIAQAIVMLSDTPTDNASWPSTSEAINYLTAHPEIRDAVARCGMVADRLRTPATTAGAMFHLFATLDEDDAEAFFSALETGQDLAADSPILRLREFMLREIGAPRRVGRPQLQARWIKSWNAWRKGRPMVLLNWKPGGSKPESFPRPE